MPSIISTTVIASFYTDSYNSIANYIREYVAKKRKHQREQPSSTISRAAMHPIAMSCRAKSRRWLRIITIRLTSERSMPDCAAAIAEEKSRLSDKAELGTAIQGKTDEEKAILIKPNSLKNKAARRAKKKNS
jgi:hypothetical protein